MKIKLIATVLLLASSFSAYSNAAKPIKKVTYYANKVVDIVAGNGIVTEIVFESDERITYQTSGYEKEWNKQVVLDNVLVLKPLGDTPQTNLIVHTNKRSYVFNLKMGNINWSGDARKSNANFSVRMRYYDPLSIANLKKSSLNEKLSLKSLKYDYKNANYDYRATANSEQIIPVKLWDNGILTFIEYSKGTRRGVVYEVDAISGLESLVNQHTESNGINVLHGVYDRLMIRYDQKAVEIRRNEKFGRTENFNKTNVKDTKRTGGIKADNKPLQKIKKNQPKSVVVTIS